MPRREYEQVARDLKPIYTAVDADAAHQALEAFDEKWGGRFPVITQAWLNSWEYVVPFLAFPPEVRRVIYTTNAIEALNRQLRKAIKTKGHFPNEEAARKLIYLAITNAVPAWTRTRNWTTALLAFKIHFGDRLPDSNQTPPTRIPVRQHDQIRGNRSVQVAAAMKPSVVNGSSVVCCTSLDNGWSVTLQASNPAGPAAATTDTTSPARVSYSPGPTRGNMIDQRTRCHLSHHGHHGLRE